MGGDRYKKRLRLYWTQLFYQIYVIVRISENYRNVASPDLPKSLWGL